MNCINSNRIELDDDTKLIKEKLINNSKIQIHIIMMKVGSLF